MTYSLLILAVLLSFVAVYFLRPKKNEGLRLLLAFSGAFLLALTIFELFPKVYIASETREVGVFIMLGILLQIFLEFFSKGAEHGHVHLNKDSNIFPWLIFISLSIHAFLEGLPIESTNPILYGILIHKIPIAIILSIFLLATNISLIKAVLFMVFFSLMTPLGTYVASHYAIVKNYQTETNAIVIGVFLHISTVILFESSEGHTFNVRKLLVIILGIAIAYFL